jgi:release factor glutamine methyltransferase
VLLKNINTSEIDSEVLLAFTLQKDRSYLRAWPEKKLTAKQLTTFKRLVTRRQDDEPIAYLTGEREFWSRPFNVTPDVLIPRPDTELLIDVILEKLHAHLPYSFIDLGTGSGAIAVTLALEFPKASVTAVDLGKAALLVAKTNAQRHQVSNVTFVHDDWLAGASGTTYDLIVSNPPYIEETDKHLKEGDLKHEPRSALVSQENGLADINAIASQASSFLKPQGYLLLEHGYQQGAAVKNLLESFGYHLIEQFTDLQGHTRATLAQFNS